MTQLHQIGTRRQHLLVFLDNFALELATQGGLVPSFRKRAGKIFGPYFKIACRDRSGRQRAFYLGSDAALLSIAKERLAALQREHRLSRQLRQMKAALRKASRAAFQEMSRELPALGLYRRGSEIRGWSTARIAPG